MQHYLLDLIHFEYHHTGTKIKEKLLQLIDKMNLNEKILSLTTDNNATIVLYGKYMTNEFGIQSDLDVLMPPVWEKNISTLNYRYTMKILCTDI